MDLKKKITKHNYLILKTEIKALAAAGKYLRIAAEHNKGDVRRNLRDKKSAYGDQARLHYLAYGFLRGRKHSEIEPTANPDNVPSIKTLDKFIRHILRYDRLGYYYIDSGEYDKDLRAFFNKLEEAKAA